MLACHMPSIQNRLCVHRCVLDVSSRGRDWWNLSALCKKLFLLLSVYSFTCCFFLASLHVAQILSATGDAVSVPAPVVHEEATSKALKATEQKPEHHGSSGTVHNCYI